MIARLIDLLVQYKLLEIKIETPNETPRRRFAEGAEIGTLIKTKSNRE